MTGKSEPAAYIPSWDGRYPYLEEFEIRVENFVLGTQESRRNECGPRLYNARKDMHGNYNWVSTGNVFANPGAQQLSRFFRDIMTREPSFILFETLKYFFSKAKLDARTTSPDFGRGGSASTGDVERRDAQSQRSWRFSCCSRC